MKDFVPFWKLPELFQFADSVVSASHGEGWGLPLMESMSMELPTAAVAWSGNTEFMTNENSFLIDLKGFTADGVSYHEHVWADLDVEHLRITLRGIYGNSSKVLETKKQARDDIIHHWDCSSLSHKMALMFKEIADNKEHYKHQNTLRTQPPPPEVPPTRIQIAAGTFTYAGRTYQQARPLPS